MLKRLSLILLPLALGLLLPSPEVNAAATSITENQAQTQQEQAADKRKAKWIVTGTILRMVEQKQYEGALYIANQGVSKYPDNFGKHFLSPGFRASGEILLSLLASAHITSNLG